MTGPSAIMTGRAASVPLLDPDDDTPLRRDTPHSLVGEGAGRWPVVAGIPFLRSGRDALRRAALGALDSRDERAALVLLLADQDDYARTPPPDALALSRLIDEVDDGSATLRDAMRALNFGPVADYFAYRWSAPTYLSGLALLGRHWLDGATVIEVASGIGHFLRDLAARGVRCLGVDVVFAKLWLARRFVVPEGVDLVCADAVAGWPLGVASGPAVAFCHDAFYFLPDKARVVAAWRRTIGDGGRILIGHAHNVRFDHGGVAGEPRTPEEYAALLPGGLVYDDAELARSVWAGERAGSRDPAELGEVEAVAMAWEPSGRLAEPEDSATSRLLLEIPPSGSELRLNPLLVVDGGTLRPEWPSARFRAEYEAASGYLLGEPPPRVALPCRAGSMDDDEAEIDRLARRRILLDLPERW